MGKLLPIKRESLRMEAKENKICNIMLFMSFFRNPLHLFSKRLPFLFIFLGLSAPLSHVLVSINYLISSSDLFRKKDINNIILQILFFFASIRRLSRFIGKSFPILESIYLYFPPSSQLLYLCFCPVGLSLL